VTEEIGAAAFEAVPGTQIAGYQVEAEIGRGGMAIVYRALDGKLGRPVALKILSPALAEDESFRRRFIHESRAAASVDHPNIVPVFEAGEADGCLFIAMRYVGTGDVRTLLQRQGRLPLSRVVAIVSQVASALDVAHSRGLVHRDIKPANMLLAESADGRSDHVYLSDFGLSKLTLAPTGLTSTGQFMGTLDYVAPEQIEGKAIDGRADLYALACTTVEMLSGLPPFRRAENMALMWAQLSEPPPRLTERCPELPPGIDDVIFTGLAKAPGDRYLSCGEFAAALHSAAQARGPAPWAPARGGARAPTEQAYLPGAPHTALDAPAPLPGAAAAGPPGAGSGTVFPAAAGGVAAAGAAAAGAAAAGLSARPDSATPGTPASPSAWPGSSALAGPPGPSAWPGSPGPAGPAGPAGLSDPGGPAGPASWPASAGPAPWSAAAGTGHPSVPPPSAGMPYPPAASPSGSAWSGSAWSESDLPPAPDDWFRPPGPASQQAPAASQAPVDPRWLTPGTPATMPPGSAARAASRVGAGHGRDSHGRGGRGALVVVIAVIVAACLAVAAFMIHRQRVAAQSPPVHQSAPASSAVTTPAQVTPVAPADVVQAYFRAINHHRYARAWALGGRNTGETYSQFVSGFSNTAHDAVQIASVSGDVVSARLVATQTDSTVQTYQGTYTVQSGRITQFNIRRVS
jgi:Protein kinase domain